MRKFLIYAPPYWEKYGGIIALHRLCDLINQQGGVAYLHPYLDLVEANALNIDQAVVHAANQRTAYQLQIVERQFGVRPDFNTPVRHIFDDGEYGDDWIVVYPEITFGNPLRARNVVRWLLHNPGFHTGRIGYGPGELHFRCADHVDKFRFPGCRLSDNLLEVVTFNLDIYNTDSALGYRSGTAYCLRKGRGKALQHDVTNSILIDDLSQVEIADVFKRVQTFYSYDTKTTYSYLAVLCGCDSVVIPDPGVPETEWHTDETARYGIAYGVENIEWSRETSHLVRPRLEYLEARSSEHVSAFMKESDAFFG